MALFGRKSKSSSAKVAASSSVAAAAPATRPPVATISSPEREEHITQIGVTMLDIAKEHKAGLLSAKFYQDKLMDWSMKDHNFRSSSSASSTRSPRSPPPRWCTITSWTTSPSRA